MLLAVMTIDPPRFIQVFIVQGIMGMFYLYIAYRILKREGKGLNLILSGFYINGAIGAIINIIYTFIFYNSVVTILHFLTYFMVCLSFVFLLIFVLILAKSEGKINKKVRWLLITSFSILFFGLLFIPDGITINASTNWKPEWSLWFCIYSIVLTSIFIIFPTLFYSLRLYNRFEHQELRKRWKFFIIGIGFYFFLFYGTTISNTLADQTFRLVWSLLSLPVLISAYFIYYGVGKQI